MIAPVVVHCGFGALLAVSGIPLALRKVPMNRWYGVRLPESYASEERWYDINAYGGRLFVIYGIAVLLFGGFARDLAPAPTDPMSALFTIGPLLGAFIPIVMVVRYARRDDQG